MEVWCFTLIKYIQFSVSLQFFFSKLIKSNSLKIYVHVCSNKSYSCTNIHCLIKSKQAIAIPWLRKNCRIGTRSRGLSNSCISLLYKRRISWNTPATFPGSILQIMSKIFTTSKRHWNKQIFF